MSFHVGQLVVCRPKSAFNGGKPFDLGHRADGIYPKPGGIYTIRAVKQWPEWTSVLLEEIDNSHVWKIVGGCLEPGFDHRHFHPIDSGKISIFTAMLNPVPKREVEDA